MAMLLYDLSIGDADKATLFVVQSSFSGEVDQNAKPGPLLERMGEERKSFLKKPNIVS